MPRVRKTEGASVYYRPLERDFEIGDEADVPEEDAQHLVEVRGDFERVEASAAGDTEPTGDDVHEEDGPPDDTVPVDDLIEQGICPWCDDYEGDAVGQHASSAHPAEWTDYKED